MGSNNIIYGINDKPKFGLAVLLGMQHVFTLFGATTLVPLILGGAIFGNDNAAMANFVGNVYLGMGIATLLQLYAGSGLPIIQGSSFAFLTPFFAIIAIVKTCGGGGAEIMQALAGALIAGGLIETVLGYTGFVGRLKKIITPVVIGPTIMLIGFSLFDIAVGSNAAKYWPVSLLVVALIFFFSLIAKGKTRLFPVLLSIIISYVICLILSALNVFEQGHPAYVNLDAVKNSDWFRMPVLFPYGRPHFNPSAIFAVLAAFLASIIESIGDYHSVSYAAGLKDPEPKTISKGIGAEGLGCVINGLFGGAATTSYTENIGLINITKVASRYV
nr:solute carrier family 23 protein [bacterium]